MKIYAAVSLPNHVAGVLVQQDDTKVDATHLDDQMLSIQMCLNKIKNQRDKQKKKCD